MEGSDPEEAQVADDLDDINTLVNLLELRSRLRMELHHFEIDLD